MSGRLGSLWVMLIAAAVAALGVVGTGIAARVADADPFRVVLHAAAAALFLVAGLVAHFRRPGNPIGMLMIAVSAGFLAEDLQLSPVPWIHTIGEFTVVASSGPLVHLALAYPTGRIGSTVGRVLVWVAYTAMIARGVTNALFTDWRLHSTQNAPGLLLIAHSDTITVISTTGTHVLTVLVSAAMLLVLLHRWRHAKPLLRSLLMPVIIVMLAVAFTSALGTILNVNRSLHDSLLRVYDVVFLLLPVGFLTGMLRLYLGRSTVMRLLHQVPEAETPKQLQSILTRTLHDPSLQIAIRSGDGLVDVNDLPLDPGSRSVTPLKTRADLDPAVIVHDPLLHVNQDVLDAVAAAADLHLTNQGLTVRLARQLKEVEASRARIVEAADAERKHIEKNLHDGAQQYFLGAITGIRVAQRRLRTDPQAADEVLDAVAAKLTEAHEKVRELAKGLHPAIITNAGLTAALEALAAEQTLAADQDTVVVVDAPRLDRLDEHIAVTAYYVTAEAVANALKHAAARIITIKVTLAGDRLIVRVTDDGRGGADPTRKGMVGIADRVAAAGGELRVHSPPGSGTLIEAILPIPPDREDNTPDA
ncbi:histidine kinase [Thermopolyspora sp. NPDC052614]|uniref:sensor histidine kinase n=1 Tax=Thermopolyspora sp. NPDC052614 TaxID=3155682 RepID=UPI00344A421E